MMTEALHQKITRRRRVRAVSRSPRGRLPRRGSQPLVAPFLRNLLRGPRALCGFLLRMPLLFRASFPHGRLSLPGKTLFRKIRQSRFAAKAGWGIALGVLAVFLFYFVTGSLAPHVRGRTLELSLPTELRPALAANSYIEMPSPDDPPEEDVRPQPAAAASTVPDAPPASSGGLRVQSRSVRSGDTISGIAAAAGLHLDTLISFNRIDDVRKVPAGTELKLPSLNGLLYTVRRGDSLSSIARAYTVSANALADANNLESAVIHPGQEIFIPGARMKHDDLKKILGELFIYPVSLGETRLTSRFGMRADPFTGVRRFHSGIDLAGPAGTHISAAMAGRVVKIGSNPNYGNYIIVSHADGYQTWYAHLDEALVGQGKNVVQGQLIGKMGNTGYSTGPHLHFSIFKGGSPIDPLKFLH